MKTRNALETFLALFPFIACITLSVFIVWAAEVSPQSPLFWLVSLGLAVIGGMTTPDNTY